MSQGITSDGYVHMTSSNIHLRTVRGFGDELQRFDQTGMRSDDAERLFQKYFSNFPWNKLPENAVGFDMGCGSGRWAKFVAPKVGTLYCVDPSEAIHVARKNLVPFQNCVLAHESVDRFSADHSMDFGYSLGVLHHIPDTQAALSACVRKLKPGAPFLVYLYYRFDNRPTWFQYIWRASDFLRRFISKTPYPVRYFLSQAIAVTVYWPLARMSFILEKCGCHVDHLPLSSYRNLGFYVMRTDALDRFGTQLEQRFTKDEIQEMMANAGLKDIVFNENEPYWCAVGIKR